MGLILVALLGCKGHKPSPAPDPPATPASEDAAHDIAAPVAVLPSAGTAADLAATTTFFDGRPVYERPIRVTGLDGVDGVGSLSAEACGACHPEIYAEWRTSIHSHAWVDPQFQAEIGKSANRWLCLSCHTPLLVQQDVWPRALVDDDVEQPILATNPTYDAALRDEGITCTACHLQGSTLRGPGIAEGNAPHPVQTDATLASGALCLSCHQAEATYPGKSFVCTFQTGDEWRAGPYDEEGRSCVSCHMPVVERPVAIGGPVRTVRRHWWRGAGIPKVAGIAPPVEANPPGLALEARVDGAQIRLEATNANAGHRLPTGDPERWVQIDVGFFDGGAPVGDPFTHRIAQVWEWSTPPRKVSDNRLAPREVRILDVPIPPGATRAEITAGHHRISEEIAVYHGLQDYPRSLQTHRIDLPLGVGDDTPPP